MAKITIDTVSEHMASVYCNQMFNVLDRCGHKVWEVDSEFELKEASGTRYIKKNGKVFVALPVGFDVLPNSGGITWQGNDDQ
jgi:hypothetical protein